MGCVADVTNMLYPMSQLQTSTCDAERMRATPVLTVLVSAGLGLAVTGCASSDESAAADETRRVRVEVERAGQARSVAAAPAEAPTPASTSASARTGVALRRIGTFESPLYVTAPPQDTTRQFVVEQGGRIWVIKDGARLARPFLDLSRRTSAGGERGLLGLAFSPDYASDGRFYVNYTDQRGHTRIVEFRRATDDRADPASARQLILQAQPEANHNGGQLAFGPDQLLYIGLGDGGGAGDQHGRRGNAQDLGSLLGKILRIDPRRSESGRPYSIPADNPFVGRSGARGEVYAYGLRNPWRFSFDRRTGALTIGDVSQSEVEEVDFVARGRGRGANFGWRPFEGNSRYTAGEPAPGHVRPAITRTHAAGWCSVTGGVVVRDRRLAGLYGRYVFGDFCQSVVYSARLSAGKRPDVQRTRLRVPALSSFGEDARGRVYVTSLSGPVYRLEPRAR